MYTLDDKGGGIMQYATLLTKHSAVFMRDKEGKFFSACQPYNECSPDMYGKPCGPEYGVGCMPECDPSDGSDDCDPYYP